MPFHFKRLNRRVSARRKLHRIGGLVALLVIAMGGVLFACSGLPALAIPPVTEAGESQISGQAAYVPTDPNNLSVLSPTPPPPAPGVARQTDRPTPVSLAPTEALTATRVRSALPTVIRPSPSIPVSNLLYLADDHLFLWERRSHQARQLATGVSDYSLDAANHLAILLRPRNVILNGAAVYDLDLLDLETEQITSLLSETPEPLLPSLAPAGDRVAYAVQSAQVRIFILSTQGGQPVATTGVCEGIPDPGCASLAWSPDGKMLAWSDARGVWLLTAPDQPPRLVHDPYVQVNDPEGQSSQYAVIFYALRWSTDGRFILAEVAPKDSKVRWQAVLDVRTGNLAGISDSFATEEEVVITEWLADDQIIVGRSGDNLRRTFPMIHIWQVFATNPELIVSQQKFDLYSDDFPFSAAASKSIPLHQLDWLSGVLPGKLLFGIRLQSADIRPVLFTIDMQSEKLVKLQELPADTQQLLWAPDGSGAVYIGDGEFAFITLPGGELFSLSSVIPVEATRIRWLIPTMPRKSGR